MRIKDVADVVPGEEPQFNIVTADGGRAVLLNIRSQPDGNTVAIADAVQREMVQMQKELPRDMRLAVFYDQSILVRESVGSVWESILFGLLLSVAILFGFLKSGQRWSTTVSTTAIAVVVIPVTVLAALVAMKLLHMSFNLMTLGGIAAAIGLVIDDAIVVVESIASHVAHGRSPIEAVAVVGPRSNWTIGRFDINARGGFLAVGLYRWYSGSIFPGAGRHNGRGALNIAGPGDHFDAHARGPFHSRACRATF